MYSTNLFIKFADDTTVVGLISNNDETNYRNEVQQLAIWCTNNNLSLNIEKTKEIVVDFWRAHTQRPPLIINSAAVERVSSTKFLGVHITEDLSWTTNTASLVKKAQHRLYFLCKLRRARVPTPIMYSFYRGTIEREGYAALAEALKSSHLIELDLRGNDPGASGVKLLTDLLQDPNCKLETLRLLKSPAAQEGYDLLDKVLGENPLLQRELNLGEKIKGDSQVKQLSALLKDSHCRPEILKVNNSQMTNEGCAALASALCLNPSHLRELELSGNTLGGSGMKELCAVLKNQHFKLLKLGLCKCSLTEGDCAAVVAALRTNPSHLKELDLSENTVGNTGVKELSDLLQNSNCALEILKILNTPEAEKACASLTKLLGKSPLQQKELDLSGKISGDSGVKELSDLLKDPHCTTEKLRCVL
ncbi:hypothetical protein PDJAM_G00260460 [Pangasius djambal]|nr:hypothetical protein [Pangasius djambal]